MTETAPRQAAAPQERKLLTVDCDIHPRLRNGLRDLLRYMPEAWRQRIGGGHASSGWAKEVYASEFSVPKNVLYVNPVGVMRRDTILEDGAVPASNPRVVAEQLLDPYDIDRAVLIGGNMLGPRALPPPPPTPPAPPPPPPPLPPP